jgi:hypothetical protein
MAFKPKSETDRPQREYEPRNIPVPRGGLRKGRISLIVDLGVQENEEYVDPKTQETRQPKPCQQVAVFIDLTHDVVDYGGQIGTAPYRISVNHNFAGEWTGINFKPGPQRDPQGNILKDANGKWLPKVIPPTNMIAKLCKAVGRSDIAVEGNKHSFDLEQLLNQPLTVTVEVKETPDKNGKKDKEGNTIVYKNVNFKSVTPVPEDDDGNPQNVNPLAMPARVISFDSATKEDIKFIRSGLIKKIKLAQDYAGSAMQRAIEAFESEQNQDEGDEDEAPAPTPAPAPKPAAKAPKKNAPAPKSDTGFDDMDDDVPF